MENQEDLLRPALGTFEEAGPHPSNGGNPYSDDTRDEIIARWERGMPLVTPELEELRDIYKFPAYITCHRWIERHRMYGHHLHKLATGNHEAEREVLGQAIVNLAMYRVVHPEAPISHARAFLFNADPTIAPFCPSAVVRAEQLLGLRMKASSTTCERTYWPRNMHKRAMFWTFDYPSGHANVSTRDMIDMDQAGMNIEATKI